MSRLARMMRRRPRVASGGGGGGGDLPAGDFTYLFDATALMPQNAMAAGRMPANVTTGLHDGSTVDTSEPTWATTVTLTDSGNGDTNLTALQSAIDSAAGSATGNTAIRMPSTFRWSGTVRLRRNVTGFWIGLLPTSTSGLPTHVPAVSGAARPTKANRITTAHLSLMPGGVRNFGGTTHMDVDLCDVRRYYIRGIQFLNPSNFPSYTDVVLLPDSLTLGGAVVSTTANTLTLSAGAYGADLTNFTFWVHRGPASTQIFHGCNYNGTTKVLTLPSGSTWSVAPSTADEFWTFARPLPSGASPVTDAARFWPEDVHFVQCYHHGGTGQNVTRSYYLCGRRVAVCDGLTQSLGTAGQDSQDALILYGVGPYKYTNCDSSIGGPKENFLIGGASLLGQADEHLPANVEVRFNRFRSAGYGSPKCSTEIKFGRYILIEANDASDQVAGSFGGELVVKLTDQFGTNPFADTQHVTVRVNRVRNAGGMAQISGAEGYVGTNKTRNVVLAGNVQQNADQVNAGMQFGGSMVDVLFLHNTVNGGTASGEYGRLIFAAGSNVGGYVNGPGIRILRNVSCNPDPLRPERCIDEVPTTLITRFTGIGNAISDNMCNVATDDARYVGQLRAGTGTASMGFVNYASGDLRLSPASPGYQAFGGKDVGAPVALVESLMAEVS